ncbi:unnamed protein product, partial [Allacma fusca]
YGPIFQIYFGPKRTYVLSELKSLREVFSDSVHNDRPHNEAFHLLRDGLHGVVASSDKRIPTTTWKKPCHILYALFSKSFSQCLRLECGGENDWRH